MPPRISSPSDTDPTSNTAAPAADALTTHDGSDASTEDALAARDDRPSFDLSVRQMSAGAVAAVTAALLGSTLGVAGTLIGAALGSAVTMTASTVISHFLASAQFRLRSASWAQRRAASESERSRRRPRGPVLIAGTILAFVVGLLLITGFEAVTGSPVSGGVSGLTILGGDPAGVADTSPTTVEATTSPTSGAVTETVTATETTTASSGIASAEVTSPAAVAPTISESPTTSVPSSSEAPSTGATASSTATAPSTTSVAPTTQP